MSRRTERVGEQLRRELAMILIQGELRDPRLQPTASVSITAVRVTGDLGQARVFFDVLTPQLDAERVAEALRASAGRIRTLLGERLTMRRVPSLLFEYDLSIQRGARVAGILDALASERVERDAETDRAAAGAGDRDPQADG